MTKYTVEKIKKFLQTHPEVKGKVLEVGSRDINGSIKQRLIRHGLEYTGLDMIAPADIIANAHDIKAIMRSETYDLVICMDTLEHDNMFWITIDNMRWVLKKGGWLVICTPSYAWSIHEWPGDYYRFSTQAFREIFFVGYKELYMDVVGDPIIPSEIFAWGRKP